MWFLQSVYVHKRINVHSRLYEVQFTGQHPVKRKCYQTDELPMNGFTRSCHFKKLWWSQRWKPFCLNDCESGSHNYAILMIGIELYIYARWFCDTSAWSILFLGNRSINMGIIHEFQVLMSVGVSQHCDNSVRTRKRILFELNIVSWANLEEDTGRCINASLGLKGLM